MSSGRKPFQRASPDRRRDELIEATLRLIARSGLSAASVRAIADEAGVTQGLVTHYFGAKDDLIAAAFERHMTRMSSSAMASTADLEGHSPHRRLADFVVGSIEAPEATSEAVSQWAAFIHLVQHSPPMLEVHRRAYLGYRDTLQELIAQVLAAEGRPADPAALRRLAIACNAVIDGLWLEGGMTPDSFDPGETATIALSSVWRLLDLPDPPPPTG